MRIAVFLESLPDTGGGFQQGLSTVEALTARGASRHECVVFTPYERTRLRLEEHGIPAVVFAQRGVRLVDVWASTLAGNAILRRLRRLGFRRLGRHLDALLEEHGIDLLFFNEAGGAVLRIGDHPFFVSVWDLDHRVHPEFPEAFRDRKFERRERYLQSTLTRAVAVVSNSAYGSRRISALYKVDADRIVSLPFVPSVVARRHAAGHAKITSSEVIRKYSLNKPFVFYPVCFLPQKNHLYLLEGLVDLHRRHGIVLNAVFCGGGDAEQRGRVELQVQALGLHEQVRVLGWVPDEDVPALYQEAVALVMPTYCGPTNLPPLEAALLECPVVYSDMPGCREQMGNAALYCDLTDVSTLADHLLSLIRDQPLRQRMIEAGRRLSQELDGVDYSARLSRILDDYEYVRRRWAWPPRTQG